MALNFGQMTNQILSETFSDASVYTTNVQNAIVTAIKELETNQMFFNQTDTFLSIVPNIDTVALPVDFINLLQLTLIAPPQNSDPTIPPAPPPYPPGTQMTIYTGAQGFTNCTFYELKTYRYYGDAASSGSGSSLGGTPGRWALYGNNIEIYPCPDAYYFLHIFYYQRDGSYPVLPTDTSIWMGDFTQDVTRYRARAIFYRDTLQSMELAASDMARSEEALVRLKNRASDRSTIQALSY